MTKHLESCIRERAYSRAQVPVDGGTRKFKVYHLRVEGHGLPEYWMHLQVRADATLEELDQFLRGVWLECCGHLSAFTIHGERYASDPIEDLDEEGMEAPIGKVLRPGVRFLHEYDYGTTTELILRVISEYEARVKTEDEAVQLLARNEPPPLTCHVCGRPATLVCTQCIDMDEGWLCDECASDHECGEEMLLPVVNSPRVGMCGYAGDPDILI